MTTLTADSKLVDMPAAHLAALAVALQDKLQRLGSEIDPKRLLRLQASPEWASIDFDESSAAASPERASIAAAAWRRARTTLYLQYIGGLPALTTLLQPWARLALLPPERIQAQLCVLALARRPGVLRCSVEKTVRQEWRRVLGPAHEQLSLLCRHGRPVTGAHLRLSPAQWTRVGFDDWRNGLVPHQPALHRLVDLSIPDTGSEAEAWPSEDAELKAPEAVERLATVGLTWPA
jgi:Bacterial type III secretion protein (HrpB4)